MQQSINSDGWWVIFPIENLEIAKKILLGKVIIYPSGSNPKKWRTIYSKYLKGDSTIPYHQLALLNCAFALVILKCDRAKAIEEALLQAETAVNTLRLLEESFGCNRTDVTGFGIMPTAAPLSKIQVGFGFNEKNNWISRYKRIGPLAGQVFLASDLGRMKKSLIFKRLKGILSKPDGQKTEVEIRIINAINWFAEAKKEEMDDLRFIMFILVIELLLSDEGDRHGGRIATNISERMAFILARKRNFQEKKSIYAKMKELYNLRSRIIHEGKKQITSNQLKMAKYFSQRLIETIVKKSKYFEKNKEFIDWIEDERFK